jgi:hypothetical protein
MTKNAADLSLQGLADKLTLLKLRKGYFTSRAFLSPYLQSIKRQARLIIGS